MIPTWAAVLTAVSLVVIALAAIVVALATWGAAAGFRTFLRSFEQIAGPAVGDLRGLIDAIRQEADSLVGTSRDIRLRIVKAADAAESRLQDLDSLIDVVQDEVEDTALDVAAAVRNVRRGITFWRAGRRILRPRRRDHGRRD